MRRPVAREVARERTELSEEQLDNVLDARKTTEGERLKGKVSQRRFSLVERDS